MASKVTQRYSWPKEIKVTKNETLLCLDRKMFRPTCRDPQGSIRFFPCSIQEGRTLAEPNGTESRRSSTNRSE